MREYGTYPIMNNYVSTHRLLQMYGMHRLEERRCINDLMYLYDIVNSVLDSQLI
jgi:hypothetical protein